MNSLLAVEKGLPPGLWLPTADESTEKYLKQNFEPRDYEDIIDYGAFVVSLTVLASEETGRISMMPVDKDLHKMHTAGYGVSTYRIGNEGGVKKLQQALGFYPRGYLPDNNTLSERLKWMAEYAYPLAEGDEALDNLTLDGLLHWGATRKLGPQPHLFYRNFGDTSSLRIELGLIKRYYPPTFSQMGLNRFGARVIAENGRPLGRDELDAKYGDEFPYSKPFEVIVAMRGSLRDFWQDFGYASAFRGIKGPDIINLGVRWAIQNDGEILRSKQIEQLSLKRKFPTTAPVKRYLGSIPEFQAEVENAYNDYLEMEDKLVSEGISKDVVKLACQRYETDQNFGQLLQSNSDTMRIISGPSRAAKYVRRLIGSGLDLLDESTFALQLQDLINALNTLGITDEKARSFIADLIPRFEVEEVIKEEHLASNGTPLKF